MWHNVEYREAGVKSAEIVILITLISICQTLAAWSGARSSLSLSRSANYPVFITVFHPVCLKGFYLLMSRVRFSKLKCFSFVQKILPKLKSHFPVVWDIWKKPETEMEVGFLSCSHVLFIILLYNATGRDATLYSVPTTTSHRTSLHRIPTIKGGKMIKTCLSYETIKIETLLVSDDFSKSSIVYTANSTCIVLGTFERPPSLK